MDILSTMKKKDFNNKEKNLFSGIPPSYWLFIFSVILYVNTLSNGYNFDDTFVVQNNPTIRKGIEAIPEIFTSRYWTEKDNTFGYRPVVRASFAMEMSLWGENPTMSHLVNILLYALGVFVAYKVIRKIFFQIPEWIIFSGFLLFISHPLHTEVVASLKNREDLLVLILGFLCILIFLKFSETRKSPWLFLGLIVFFITCLTKENGIVFMAIIPAALFFSVPDNKISKEFFKKNQTLLISAFLLLVIGIIALNLPNWILPAEQKELFYFENPLHFIHIKSMHYATGFFSLLYYLKMLILPYPLLFYYGYNMIEMHTFTSLWVWLSIIIFVFMVVFTIKYFYKNSLFAFSIILYFVNIFIYSNIYLPVNGIVAERYVFIASLGFILAILSLFYQFKILPITNLSRVKKTKSGLIIPVIIITVVFSILTLKRNAQWKDYKTLMSSDIEFLNNSAKAQTSYATVLFNELKDTLAKGYKANSADVETILRHYKRSVEIYPKMYNSMNNIGLIYLSMYKNIPEAMSWFKKALENNQDYTEASYNLAYSYLQVKDTNSALTYFNQVLRYDSTHTASLSDMANIYYAKKDSIKALGLNYKLMKTDTLTDLPYINLGNYALLGHDTVTAVKWWEKAILKNPDNPKLCYGLGMYFTQHGDLQKGNYYLKLSKKLR